MNIVCIVFLILNSLLLLALFLGDTKKIALACAKTLFAGTAEYLAVSQLLFAVSRFSLELACGVSFVFSVILCSVMIFLKGGIKEFISRIKDRHVPGLSGLSALIIVIGLVCCILLPGAVGASSDTDSYQLEAVQIMNGDSSVRLNLFEECMFKDEVISADKLYSSLPVYKAASEYFSHFGVTFLPGKGILANAPTYSALLALAGSVFGKQLMTIGNFLFLAGIGIFVSEITEKLKFGKFGGLAALAGTMLLPTTVWFGKTAGPVIELMFMAVGITLFILNNYVSENSDENRESSIDLIYAAAGLVSSVCVSLNSLWFLPAAVVLMCITASKKDRIYQVLVAGITSGMCVLFAASHFLINYHYYRYEFMAVQSFARNLFSMIIPLVVPLICCLIALLCLLKGVRAVLKKYALEKGIYSTSRIIAFILLVSTVLLVWKTIADGQGSDLYLLFSGSFAAVSIATGIIVLPLIIYLLFFKASTFENRCGLEVIIWVFSLCLLVQMIYPTFMVTDGYYDFQCMAPFMFTVPLLFGAWLSSRKACVNVTALALIFMVPFTSYAVTARPETVAEWSEIDEMADFLSGYSSDTVVIFDKTATDVMIAIKQANPDISAEFFVDGTTDKRDRVLKTYDYLEMYDTVLYVECYEWSDEDDGQIFTVRSNVQSDTMTENEIVKIPLPTYSNVDSYAREYRIYDLTF